MTETGGAGKQPNAGLRKPRYPVADPKLLPPRVFVYRNLHQKLPDGSPMYSVRDVATGLVVAHVGEITLANVQFKVSEAGRQRVLREKRKNVHAGVEGTPTTVSTSTRKALRPAAYDPYRYATFVDRITQSPILSTNVAVIDTRGVHYSI